MRRAPAALALLLPAAAWGFAFQTSLCPPTQITRDCIQSNQTPDHPVGVVVRRAQVPVTLYSSFGSTQTGGDFDAQVERAASEWNQAAAAVRSPFRWLVQRTPPGTVDVCNTKDGQDAAGWTSDFCGILQERPMDVGDALGLTITEFSYVDQAPSIVETAIVVRAEGSQLAGGERVHWIAALDGEQPHVTRADGTVAYDFHRVILHEMGHALGLGHPDDAGQQVDAIMNSKTSRLFTVQADDRRGLAYLYPPPEGAAPGSAQPVAEGAPSRAAGGGGGGAGWPALAGLGALAARRLSRR